MNISDHSFDNIIWPKGEHPGWAWSNQVSPLKVAFFFWLVAEEDVREMHSSWPGRKQMSMLLTA